MKNMLEINLLWSQHICTIYLLRPLNTNKKIAVCSVKSFDAKVNKPNGPNLLLLDAFSLSFDFYFSISLDLNLSFSPPNDL